MNKKYSELAELFRSEKTDEEILDFLLNYHKNDIADMMAGMTEEERKRLYHLLGAQKVAEIFKYIEEPRKYIRELSVESAARVISEMDSDDAVDLLEDLDPEEKEQIVRMLDEDAKKDVKMLLSYDEEEIGSCMTTNYICIPENLTIRQAMSELVKQAGENDNIMTIYVVDEKGVFAGAIDLKDLIRARENAHLEDLVLKSYPYVTDHEKIDDCMDRILDYAEDSIPVLSEDKKILGVITSEDLIEMVDNEMGEDYAKLAGLTAEEDLKEPTLQSMKKRLPWLIILLFLGMAVSSVVGLFENVVAVLPIGKCGNPVPGSDNPCADGREPDRKTEVPAGGQGSKDRFLKRSTVGHYGITLSRCLCASVQRIYLDGSLWNLRLRGSLPLSGNGDLQCRRYGDPHVFP